jgi:hypothetical protein
VQSIIQRLNQVSDVRGNEIDNWNTYLLDIGFYSIFKEINDCSKEKTVLAIFIRPINAASDIESITVNLCQSCLQSLASFAVPVECDPFLFKKK